MSSVIGSLRVNLGLDSAKFERGARNVNKPLQAMKKQFAMVATAAAALGGALAALTIGNAKLGREIKQFAQVANTAPEQFQKWAAASKTVGIEQEKLADILKDVNDRVGDFVTTGGGPMKDFFEQIAPKVGITADAFRDLSGPDALQLYVTSLEKAGLSQQEMTFYLEAMASDATALIPLLRNGGEEMNRLADNAQSLGGIMQASTVASLAALDLALGDVATSIRGVGYRISGELAPILTVMAEGFADAMREGAALRTAIDFLIANIDTLAASVGVLVAFLGVKLVAAMAVSLGATSLLTGAFVLLRAAIFATGFGAIVIGAGFAIAKFADLVKSTGSFGEALVLLKDVAQEVWSRIKIGFVGLEFQMAAGWLRIKASALETFGDIAVSALENVNTIVGAFVGAKDAIIAAWEALPSAFSNIGARAINALIDKISSGISAVIAPVNAMLEGVGLSPIAAPDLSEWRVVVGEAAVVGGKAKAAFDAAMSVDYSGAGSFNDNIGATVADMRAAGDIAADLALGFKRVAAAPLSSWGALKAAVTGVTTETQTATDAADELANSLNELDTGGAGGSTPGGGAVDGLRDKVESLKETANEMKDTFRDAFKGLITGAKSFGEAVGNVLNTIADKLLDSAFDALWGGAGGGGGLGGFVGNLFGGLFGSAKGNVFSGGSAVTAFANGGIVNGPTLFPMNGSQTGLMGEAGPEAIMPLSRGKNGKLGVQTGVGGGATLTIIAPEGFSVQQRGEIQGIAVQVTSEGISGYDRSTLPKSVERISNDPRRRG